MTPRCGQVRVRLLNPRPERVKIYKGSKIATLEEVDEPVSQIAAVGTMEQEAVPPGKEAMLRELVEKAGPELSVSERNEFFHLLRMLTYSQAQRRIWVAPANSTTRFTPETLLQLGSRFDESPPYAGRRCRNSSERCWPKTSSSCRLAPGPPPSSW